MEQSLSNSDAHPMEIQDSKRSKQFKMTKRKYMRNANCSDEILMDVSDVYGPDGPAVAHFFS